LSGLELASTYRSLMIYYQAGGSGPLVIAGA
jgi:hypothetical protein